MSDKKILDYASSPAAIRRMTFHQLSLLARDLREELIHTVADTGGHLASNLGVVELTIAMLRVFDVPNDKIVWDVGHQCYSYKILTGRRDRFPTLRQEGGLSGFPKTNESRYDAFIAGHASTSVAAAYGLKRAMTQRGESGSVVAVIGDGAMTGGMFYEGINNAGKSGENLIIVLNDNEMAISKNEGALAKYLSVMRSKPGYFEAKKRTDAALKRIPVVGVKIRDLVKQSKAVVKQAIYPSTFFEEFGFYYLGPVDGHSIRSLCDVLTEAKKVNGPVMVHIQTKKGKGYPFAEQNPGAFHGVSRFDVGTGRPHAPSEESFSSVFGKRLVELSELDSRICAVTAAMEHGTGLQYFARRFKDQGRYFDVGIAEEFGVTFSAALGAGGMLPVFAVYSTFLQRGFDQLIHDAAIEKRHVVFGVDRAGIVGDDGETHQGVFDTVFLSAIPGMTVYAPANYDELRAMLEAALYECAGPVAVRYPRGKEAEALAKYRASKRSFDHIEGDGKQTLLVTYGRIFAEAREAAERCGRPVSILKLNRIAPIDEDAVAAARNYQTVLFLEEGMENGGIAMQFAAKLSLSDFRGCVKIRAIRDFVPQSTVSSALHTLGLDADGILKLIDESAK